MNKEEYILSISEAFLKLHPLMVSQFVKPMEGKERMLLPPGHFHLLHTIYRSGRPSISMTELSLATCVNKSNLTAMVDRLCDEGFLERHSDENDRRIVNVMLTDKCHTLMRNKKREMVEMITARLHCLDEADLIKLKTSMADVLEIISKL
jgi:DNA-binding MarR family transcriptional regulator